MRILPHNHLEQLVLRTSGVRHWIDGFFHKGGIQILVPKG